MNALGIIFANKHDIALEELTDYRTLGAVPFGGRYRLIDFQLSNMVNAGILNVGVITRKNYQSLMRHIGSGSEWDLDRKQGGLTILPPFGGNVDTKDIYSNRLGALLTNLEYIEDSKEKYAIITDCTYVANVNFEELLRVHEESGAKITGIYSKKARFVQDGIKNTYVNVNLDGRITDLIVSKEKHDNLGYCLNTWIMEKEYLLDILHDAVRNEKESLRLDIIKPILSEEKIMGYENPGEVLCLNDISSFTQANLALLEEDTRLDLFHSDNGPIITRTRDSAPTRYGKHAKVENSLIADGCIIDGEVKNSVIFRGVEIGEGTKIENSVVMLDVTVGRNVILNYAVIDDNSTIHDARALSGYVTHPFFCAAKTTI